MSAGTRGPGRRTPAPPWISWRRCRAPSRCPCAAAWAGSGARRAPTGRDEWRGPVAQRRRRSALPASQREPTTISCGWNHSVKRGARKHENDGKFRASVLVALGAHGAPARSGAGSRGPASDEPGPGQSPVKNGRAGAIRRARPNERLEVELPADLEHPAVERARRPEPGLAVAPAASSRTSCSPYTASCCSKRCRGRSRSGSGTG